MNNLSIYNEFNKCIRSTWKQQDCNFFRAMYMWGAAAIIYSLSVYDIEYNCTVLVNKYNLAIVKGLRRYVKSIPHGSDVRLVSIILTEIIFCVCSDHVKDSSNPLQKRWCRAAEISQDVHSMQENIQWFVRWFICILRPSGKTQLPKGQVCN